MGLDEFLTDSDDDLVRVYVVRRAGRDVLEKRDVIMTRDQLAAYERKLMAELPTNGDSWIVEEL